jgi:quercetin dioxygenase-like cupin family protein
MRIAIIALALIAVVSLSMLAQQPGGQRGQAPAALSTNGYVSAAELAAVVAKQPKDRNGNQRLMQLPPYGVNMEHRVNVPQNASIHDKDAELFYVIDGAGTIVTGGTLTNARKNGDNSTGSGIEGGTTRKLAKGDFVLVPEGVPHWFSAIDGELTLVSVHLPRTPAAK